MDHAHDSVSLSRWMAARRLTLGVILLAGSMATSAAAVQKVAEKEARCRGVKAIQVYSGIGVSVISRDNIHTVSKVFAGGPSEGKLQPGALLVAVDGERPEGADSWIRALKGPVGTQVQVEVAYPGLGHESVTIERAVIHAPAPR